MKRTTQDLGPTKTETPEPGSAAEKGTSSGGTGGTNAKTPGSLKSGANTKGGVLPSAKTVTNVGIGKSNGSHSGGQVSGELAAILASLQTMRDGDFCVGLAGGWT